jgi:glycosyltransferase involved in cell wall biosynthesis
VHGGQEIHAPWWRVHQHAIHYLNVLCGRFLQQAVVAVSAELGNALRTVYGAEKVHVIENAIDVGYVDAVAHGRPQVAVTQDAFNIAIVGRLVPVKRHDLLLAALRDLRAAGERGWRLFVIGDGPLKASTEALCADYGLADAVQFTGAVDPVYPLLARMDLLVMPSDHEGLPMTLLEAMALQVPVIAHRVGGIPVVVGDGDYATLVDAHTPDGYRDAIGNVMRDAAMRDKKAQDARNHVRSSYDVTAKTAEFVALYRQLLRG